MSNTISKQSNELLQSKKNYLKLLSIIAHNVKGPVRYMEFITDYTLRNWEQMKPEDLLECATAINDSAHSIAEQLGNMLSWARLQDGTFKPNKRPFFLKNSLEGEIQLQRTIIKLKQISIIQNVDEGLELYSDSNLLNLAFHNILSNAIKFTAKSGQIYIDANKSKNIVVIVFKDTGIGMTADELALVYNNKAFSKPGTVNEQGTGFGLHISKEIIDLLNGTLEVASEVGVGTTVTVSIPD